ncbi:hypothetical protein Tco_1340594, partial [Tanacetum coccineum]
MDEAKTTKEIDWNDPSVIRYHSLKMKPKSIAQARRNMIKYLKNQGNFKITDFKGMSYNEIRPIFEKLWDFNQKFVPMDAEKERTKSPEKERSTEKIVEEEAGTQEERKEAINEPAAKRKKSIPRKTTRNRQKLEVETEKEELKTFLDIVPREEAPIDIDFKGMSYNEIRPIFEKVWDFNQNIEPMDVEHGSEKKKSPEKSPEKMKSAEKMEEEDVATQKEIKEVSKETRAKRKKSIPRKTTRKRQKMEKDVEKSAEKMEEEDVATQKEMKEVSKETGAKR